MPNPLPADDFRSVRIVLEDEDFALPPKNPNHVPRDLIERDVWNSIVILPDDVSVRTSNEYGQLLKGMDRCWDAWIESLAMRKDPIESAILDTADEFHAGTYNSLHGFYRQAFGCLRNALEVMTVATFCQVTSQRDLFKRREEGTAKIEFGKACDGLLGSSRLGALRARLKDRLDDSIFDQRRGPTDRGGWARRLFSDLSEYEHSRPSFRNIDMWESNGPVFSPKAFTRFAAVFFETAALCFLMVKMARPRFSLPERAKEIWESQLVRPSTIAVASRDVLF